MKKKLFFIGVFLTSLGLFYFLISSPYRYLFESNTNIRSGKIAKAVYILEEAHRLYPNDRRILFPLARVYLLSGEVEEANKLVKSNNLSEVLIDNIDYQGFLVGLAEANYRAGNLRYARVCILNYLKHLEKQNKFSKRVIRNYITSGHIIPERSIELWEKAFIAASKLHELELQETIKALLLSKYFQLLSEYKSINKYDEALKVIEKAKSLGKNAEVYYQEAILFNNLGEIESTQKAFERALHIDPDNNNYKITYANALKEAAEKEKDKIKREELIEKIKLILAGSQDPRKKNILNRIIALNIKYKLSNEVLNIISIGDSLYPSLSFKIKLLADTPIKNYRVVFLDENKNEIDYYQSDFQITDESQFIEVTCKNPISNTTSGITANLFLNGEFVKEYITQY